MGKAAKRRAREQSKATRVRPPKVEFVERPFEGLTAETDIVAMREIVPAATIPARTTAEHGGQDILIASLLPDLAPAMRRQDGTLLVGLQTASRSGDANRDIANSILLGLDLAPGEVLQSPGLPEPGPRLADILDPAVEPVITVHSTFEYWVSEDQKDEADVAQAVQDSAEHLVPTVRIPSVTSAFWCRMGREFVRWIRPEDPEAVFDGLARVHAERELNLGEGTRFVGAFRTCGLLVPVFELAAGTEADELDGPMADLGKRLDAAIASTEPLTPEQRRARAGLVSRQVSLN
ncbi:hypothetical protein CZ771_09640 [Actinomycetales bacterium JB111]|nr:hypothetical protein CZ771_09640 [Actinomycetales bacterium JB111]